MTAALSPAAPAVSSSEWHQCPVCLSPKHREFVAFAELTFVECEGCGTVYKSRELASVRPADFYEEAYFTRRPSGRNKRFEHRVRKAMEWLRTAAEFCEPKRVLDVGCSMGYVLEAASRLGAAPVGLDVSQFAVDACRARGLAAEVGTLEKLPFADGAFELVHLKHVLEHTPAPRAALKEVHRVLSPGGAALIAVPDLHYWKGQRRRRTYRYFRPDDLGQQHYVYYSTASLVRLLESSGFAVQVSQKDFFRRKAARASALGRIWEPVRFGSLRLGMAFARGVSLQRELFVIARKKSFS